MVPCPTSAAEWSVVAKLNLLISTGEVSGDLQGGLLIKALHTEAAERGIVLQIHALGGRRMQQAGAQLLADTTRLGAIGLWEALPHVLPTLWLQLHLRRWLRQMRLDGVVLIDYMGANVSLGVQLKRLDPELPISYYIAPQEWAFRLGNNNTTRLVGFSDRVLAIFPEEERFYREQGADVEWVGHPLIDTLGNLPGRAEARRALGLADNSQLLLLLPASRRQEMRYLLPPLVEAATRLQRRVPSLTVIIPAGQQQFVAGIKDQLAASGLVATVLDAADTLRCNGSLYAAADLALAKSGTVNLELALQGVPQVVGYRLSPITAWIARHLMRFSIPFVSPVNLVLGEELLPELLQNAFTADAIECLGYELLINPVARQRMLDGYTRLRQRLGEPGVTRRAARAILDLARPITPASSVRS